MRPASALLLALLLLPVPAGAQGDTPLRLTVEETRWAYGPETWKPASGADDLASTGRLGSRLDAELTLQQRDAPAPATWSLEATLTDGTTTVPGHVLEQGSGRLTVRFDIDGRAATATRTAAPALEPGAWTLRVDARSATGPEGFGVARIQSHALSFQADSPGAAVPEHLPPGIDELGAGDTAWMPLAPVSGAATFTVATDAPDPVTWHAWNRNATSLPVAGEAASAWTGTLLDTTAPDGGAARLTVDTDRLDPGLHLLSAQQPGAAAVTWLLPVGPAATVTDVQAPEPGTSGPVTFHLARQDDTTEVAPEPLAGTAYALRQDALATTGHADGLGAAVLAQAPLLATGPGEARAVLDATPLRRSGETAYLFLALLTDPDGGYAGHAGFLRGAVVELQVPALEAGASGQVGLRLQHAEALRPDENRLDPGLALAARVELLVEGEPLGTTTVHVPHGGTLTRTYPHRPAGHGNVLVEARVDTGDLLFDLRENHVVLAADRDTPMGGALLPLALLAAGLATRGREPPLRKLHIEA